MAALIRRPLRVAPIPATGLAGDVAEDVPDAPDVVAEDHGGGRWSVPDADDRNRWAIVDVAGRNPAGARLVEVVIAGWRFELEVEDAARAALVERATRSDALATRGGPLEVRAIIPGRIMAVSVALGDRVTAGQQLLVVEAMKMQNELRAPRAGSVERLAASVGDTVDFGDLLVVIG